MGLLSPIQAGLSAIQANSKGLAATADNIANANTKGFRPNRVNFQSQPGGGVSVNISKEAQALEEEPGVDLTEEAININAMELAAKANAAMIRLVEETLGTLLDTLG